MSDERDSLMLHVEQMVDKLEYMKPKDELLSGTVQTRPIIISTSGGPGRYDFFVTWVPSPYPL